MPQQIAVENINVPGLTTNVNAEKYLAIRKALLKVLPALSPGMTHLPEAVFPGGATSGWWAKTVQLDLEAKGVVTRESCKPLRWHKT